MIMIYKYPNLNQKPFKYTHNMKSLYKGTKDLNMKGIYAECLNKVL